VRRARVQNSQNTTITNIKWYGRFALIFQNQVISRAISETYRIIDAKEVKNQYAKHKFPNNYQHIDMEVRVCFKEGVSTGILKYYYRIN